jgi:two-component system sensor histidine kinase KdpD
VAVRNPSWLLAARLLAVLGIVAAVVFVYTRIFPVNSTTVALTLLLAVLGIASHWGLIEALVTAITSVVCVNYFFLAPVGTLTIADPQNWIALLAFLVTAVVASQLSASARREAREAAARSGEIERLYSLSRSLMVTGEADNISEQLVGHIRRTLPVAAVAFFDRAEDRVFRAGDESRGLPDARLRDAALQETVFQDFAAGETILPVTLGGRVIGSIGFAGQAESESAYRAVASLAAIAVERARGREAASRAEAARQSQELKSAILDSVAHDFKTPLTSIKAAATGLLEGKLEADTSRDLAQVIDEEADRLNVMVTDAIQTARIDAGDLHPRREPCSAVEILERAVAACAGRLEGRAITWDIEAALPAVNVDASLVALVLRQVLDNALKYSPPDSPLHVSARVSGRQVRLGVSDRGVGVASRERVRVFDRLYRGDAGNQAPGTGMGLAIARQIVEAHDGRIWAEDHDGGGSTFAFTLPIAGEDEP